MPVAAPIRRPRHGAIRTDAPIPDGMVWNMRYRPERPAAPRSPSPKPSCGSVCNTSCPRWCLSRKRPASPSPPTPTTRRLTSCATPPPGEPAREIHHLMSLVDSPRNGLELCLGSLQEMPGGDIYSHVRRFARSGRIGYIHFRNVRGKVPRYVETFVDDGDIDMAEIVRILRDETTRRDDPRPHAGNDLRRLMARRESLRPRLHEGPRAERPRPRPGAGRFGSGVAP